MSIPRVVPQEFELRPFGSAAIGEGERQHLDVLNPLQRTETSRYGQIKSRVRYHRRTFCRYVARRIGRDKGDAHGRLVVRR